MEVNLGNIIASMGMFQMGIAIALGLMAVASLAVFVERLWVFSRSRRTSLEFAPIATKLLDNSEYKELLKHADQAKGSQLAALLGAGTRTFIAGREKPGKLGAVELARRELARKSDAIAAEVKRGMSVLASVGSVAPFVGLLGTVVGIIAAFEGIAKEGSGGIGAVSAGISEALVVTAFGLLVAIPAVLAYNHLSSKADGVLLAIDQARSEFIDHLEAFHGNGLEIAAPSHVRDSHEERGASRSVGGHAA